MKAILLWNITLRKGVVYFYALFVFPCLPKTPDCSKNKNKITGQQLGSKETGMIGRW